MIESATDRAFTDTKRRTISGELAAGSMISENDVSTRLGISRTPVREAFAMLQTNGWMRLYPKRGALILDVPPEEVDNILGVRLLIEGDAASAIADTPERLEVVVSRLRSHVANQDMARGDDDLDAFLDEDSSFHRAIIEGGGNGILVTFFDTIRDRHHRMMSRSVWHRPGYSERVVAEHGALVDALERSDTDTFRALLSEHFSGIHGRDATAFSGTATTFGP
ncbi:GntR family transcriptional regulator [Brachybacterium sp. AOP29-B2-41]|uniref:GntR family transcriptional regulator n=1 Tax=Brachybacterium sp. AOP29-B2-41 TaxID=3457704 RepID=UPI004034E026